MRTSHQQYRSIQIYIPYNQNCTHSIRGTTAPYNSYLHHIRCTYVSALLRSVSKHGGCVCKFFFHQYRERIFHFSGTISSTHTYISHDNIRTYELHTYRKQPIIKAFLYNTSVDLTFHQKNLPPTLPLHQSVNFPSCHQPRRTYIHTSQKKKKTLKKKNTVHCTVSKKKNPPSYDSVHKSTKERSRGKFIYMYFNQSRTKQLAQSNCTQPRRL